MPEGDTKPGEPIQGWLPAVVLKFLVFGAFAFVLYEALVGLGPQDLGSGRVWVVVAGMAGLLLLLGIDRLTSLKVSPKGVEATLAETQAQALQQVETMDNKDLADAARARILQAQTPSEVNGALALAMELNVSRMVDRVKEAIPQKRKLYVRYQAEPGGEVETWLVAPLDIKPGKTPATKARDYLWVHSYEDGTTKSLLLERVVGVEVSEETFDPVEIMATWKNKNPVWNVPRDWGTSD